jgi:glyoxylase-like metal-dependent hydrolase (beta-lactamase superfamily II)
MTEFREVADGVFVLRYPVLDVNVTLITGPGTALVVDTLATRRQAELVRDAVRRITRGPLTVVNTHHHFDHTFGNAYLGAAHILAHPEAAALLAATDLARVVEDWAGYHPELAELGAVTIQLPDRLVPHETILHLGDRRVVLRFLGRGHTAGDLVVHLPDVALVVAGDLVEESGPPQFDDGYPLQWPDTVAALLALEPALVVPGHGAVVGPEFVRSQHEDLAALDWLIRDGYADRATAGEVAAKAPFDRAAARVAVERGYAELSGTG